MIFKSKMIKLSIIFLLVFALKIQTSFASDVQIEKKVQGMDSPFKKDRMSNELPGSVQRNDELELRNKLNYEKNNKNKKMPDASSIQGAGAALDKVSPSEAQKPPLVEQKNSLKENKKIQCSKASDIRELNFQIDQSKKCTVSYVKAGKSEIIANQRNKSDICESVTKKLQLKLEAAGFSCQTLNE